MTAYTQTKIFIGTQEDLNRMIMDMQLADQIEIKDIHCVSYTPNGDYIYLIIYHIPNLDLIKDESILEDQPDANSIT